ncbi:hypothetical protein ACQKGI_01300 [Peribacillus muralis]|uniref:hypothetical protein n=1 Tax=Peribacillus muralis TaxID=264697 RepID=UPI003820FC99
MFTKLAIGVMVFMNGGVLTAEQPITNNRTENVLNSIIHPELQAMSQGNVTETINGISSYAWYPIWAPAGKNTFKVKITGNSTKISVYPTRNSKSMAIQSWPGGKYNSLTLDGGQTGQVYYLHAGLLEDIQNVTYQLIWYFK